MFSALTLTHPLSVLLALAGVWWTRFEYRREAVPPWRLFLPAAVVFLCSLTLLLSLSTHGKEIWLLALVIGLPMGAARGFSLRLRTDHAAGLVRVSPVRDGFSIVLVAAALAVIDLISVVAHGGGATVSPLYAAGVATCAGFLAGRSMALRIRSRTAVHLDLR